jgi:hypothetical protein
LEGSTARKRGLRIATRCADIDQFVATFNRFCGDRSVFVSTLAVRPVGMEAAFSLDLVDGTPALRGLAIVAHAWTSADNPFGRAGMEFDIRRLTAASEKVFRRLLDARAAAAVPAPADEAVNTDVTVVPVTPPPERTPGSELVLPANPLTGIPDESLEGFVECTLYEETGTFFPVEPAPEDAADPVAPPPDLAPLVPRARSPVVIAVPDPDPAPPVAVSEPRVRPPPPPPEAKRPAPPPLPPPPVPARSPVAPDPVAALFEPPIVIEAPSPPPVPAMLAPPSPPPILAPAAPPVLAPPVLAAPPRAAVAMRPSAPSMGARFTTLVHEHRRWVFAGIAAVAVVIVIAIVISASRSSAAEEPAAAPPIAEPPPAPKVAPKPAAAPPPPIARAEVDEPGEVGGTPSVGSGPCKLVVTSTPAGSMVALDGERAGPTPIAIAGPCQRRRVEISHPRYQTATRAVELAEDKPATLDVTLPRPLHKLMIDTTPPGATVSIGGRRAGTSPTLVEVMGFTSIAITIAKPGYLDVTRNVYSKVPNDHLSVLLLRRAKK